MTTLLSDAFQKKKLKSLQLPTRANVVEAVLFEQSRQSDLHVREVHALVSKQIKDIWNQTIIPTITIQRIKIKIGELCALYSDISKYKNREAYEQKMSNFIEQCKTNLFEISKCKCANLSRCSCIVENRIPNSEKSFVIDQRTTRKLIFGGINKKLTELEQQKLNNQQTKSIESTQPSIETDMPSCSAIVQKCENSIPISNCDLTNVAAVLNSSGISHRVGALICNAFLKDLNLLSNQNIIDPSRVYRSKQIVMKTATCAQLNKIKCKIDSVPFFALFFDGKKDATFTIKEDAITKRRHPQNANENHYAIVLEPGRFFFFYVNPSGNKSTNAAQCIFDKLVGHDINYNKIQAIGCDGTVFNTGHISGTFHIENQSKIYDLWPFDNLILRQILGVICELEKKLNRPLHWIICLMHFNELPLKSLFNNIDGTSAGPKSFTGPIGKSLENCEMQKVTKFTQIFSDDMPVLSQAIINDLSADQKYLYEIIHAVQTGECSAILANKRPGPLNHARFLTLSCRILRLYVALQKPSKDLIFLAKFVVRVYGPMWFIVKAKPQMYNGPKHLFKFIKLIQWLPTRYKGEVYNIINRNSYFAHSENILLAMLLDPQIDVRKRAFDIILQIRPVQRNKIVREFKKPAVNFQAETYYEMIDFTDLSNIFEPPIVKSLLEEELREFNDDVGIIEHIPLHSQAVERAIKLVSDCSSLASNEGRRNGIVHTKIALNQVIVKKNTKNDYFDFVISDLF